MRTVLSVVLLLVAGVAFAQVYSWRDANGRMHYSDTPPTDADAKAINAAPASGGTADTATAKSLAEKNMEFNKRRKDAADAAAKAEQERKAAADKNANCTQAKNALQGLESGQIRFKTGAYGERIALDGDVREAEIARARQAVDSWCK